MEASRLIREARHRAGLSLRALAQRAGTSHPTLLAYEHGRKDPSVGTLVRILRAADVEPDVTLSPRRRRDPRIGDKGDELREVLELAAMFPARHDATLDAPIFGRERMQLAS